MWRDKGRQGKVGLSAYSTNLPGLLGGAWVSSGSGWGSLIPVDWLEPEPKKPLILQVSLDPSGGRKVPHHPEMDRLGVTYKLQCQGRDLWARSPPVSIWETWAALIGGAWDLYLPHQGHLSSQNSGATENQLSFALWGSLAQDKYGKILSGREELRLGTSDQTSLGKKKKKERQITQNNKSHICHT